VGVGVVLRDASDLLRLERLDVSSTLLWLAARQEGKRVNLTGWVATRGFVDAYRPRWVWLVNEALDHQAEQDGTRYRQLPLAPLPQAIEERVSRGGCSSDAGSRP
jgi:hypothetical protein